MTPLSNRFRSLVLPFTAQARDRARQGRDARVARRRTLALESLEGRTLLTTPTINFAHGFAGASGLSLNGGASISGSQLLLTDGNTYEARSVFDDTQVNVGQFTTTFDFQIPSKSTRADGFTFTIQNIKPTEVGNYGADLGYSNSSTAAFPNSLAVKFDLFNNAGEGDDSTGVYTDGATPTVPDDDLTSSGVNLHSRDLMSATIAYDGSSQALSLTIADLATGAQFTKTYAENLAAVLGSNVAYVGFTAGTGQFSATQSIESWVFTTLPTATTTPASSITTTSATLNALVNPNDGARTSVQFQYSTDPTFAPTVETTIPIRFHDPNGVAVDAAGNVFVADTATDLVWKVSGRTGVTIGSGFSGPHGVAVDGAGDVFVADTDHNAIKEIIPGVGTKTIGSGFSLPHGVAVDGAGDVFVADTAHKAVKEVLLNGTIKTIASGFLNPVDVAVDSAGDVFVADAGKRAAVQEYSEDGTLLRTIAPGFKTPSSVAVDGAGDVFVADSTQMVVTEVLPDGATKTIGYRIFGSGFFDPTSVAVDGSGDVFAADYINFGTSPISRIKEFSPPTVSGAPSPLTGSLAQTASATLTGLIPGAKYYYRAVATSAGGTVVSATNTFQTQVATSFAGLAENPTSITYGASSVSLAGQVVTNSALPVPAGSEVSVSINGRSETTPVNPDGTFQLDYKFASARKVGQPPLSVTYSFLDSTGAFAPASDSSHTLTVTPATPDVSLNPVKLTYGTALTNSQLSGAATWTLIGKPVTVPGKLSYSSASGTVLGAGNDQAESVTFKPDDLTDYAPVTTSVTVNVSPATPNVSVSPVNLIYGTALANSQLSGTATWTVKGAPVTVPGTLSYTTPGMVLGAGNSQTKSVTFTPDDTTDYAPAATSVTVNVSPATPNVSVDPVNLTYGTALADGQLSGTAMWTVNGAPVTVPGTFSYTSASGTVLGAGNDQAESVTFTSNDMSDYTPVSATVLVNVAQATPTVSVAGPQSSVYGQPVTFTATVVAPAAGMPTGSVDFYDGLNLIDTAPLSGGTASVSTETLAVGSHKITSHYIGDANVTAGWSSGVALSVGRDNTSLAVTTSGTPAPYGQAVTFTATVAPAAPGAITPTTGAVQFKIDGKPVGSPVALSAAGTASYTGSTLAVGNHTVSASYADSAGDYNGSTGALASAQAVYANTQTALTTSTSAAVYSQTVTFTDSVSTADTTATPTGSVEFYVDGAQVRTVAVSGGTASFAASGLTAASAPHSVYARYIPSGLFFGSTSASQSVAVSQATTTTSVSASLASAYPGQAVTITATVARVSPATAVPTGLVRFYLNGGSTLWKVAPLGAGGVANLSVTNLPVGADTITANYVGTSNIAASSTAAPASVTIQQAPTAITLNPVPSATTYGTPVTLSASVTSTDTSTSLTGLVQFYDNGAKLGPAVAVSGGTATLKLAASALIAGSHPITAAFLGSTKFLASGPTSAQPIAVGSALTSLSAGATVVDTTVTIAGTVADTAGAPASTLVPTGVIKIMSGTTVLATVSLTTSGTFSKSLTLAHGAYTVTIMYVPAKNAQGQSNFAGDSEPLTFTV
jgi:sugar lactone lactonase YvrE